MARPIPVQVPAQFAGLFGFLNGEHSSFRVMHGGRSGGKTRTAVVGVLVFIEWLESTLGRPANVVCARETQKSIAGSAKLAIDNQIDRLDLRKSGRFESDTQKVWSAGGSVINFIGISETHRTDRALFSLEGVDLAWFEQAEFMSIRSREVLYPTILRNEGAEIWLTFNPRFADDPAYVDFVDPGTRRDNAVVMHGNFLDMPARWRTAAEEAERLACELYEPHRYGNIWEGKLDTAGQSNYFAPDWPVYEQSGGRRVRAWDLAASEPSAANPDPDWTVGLLLERVGDQYGVLDVQRVRDVPYAVEQLILETARADGVDTTVIIEQEPGATGISTVHSYVRLLNGVARVLPYRPTTSKTKRARELARAQHEGRVALAKDGDWQREFKLELGQYRGEGQERGVHDDQVDAASMGYNHLSVPAQVLV